MATQTVSYTSNCQLNCGPLPADVILCVPASKVESPDCPIGDPNDPVQDQAYSRSYIEATLIAVNPTPVNCGCSQTFRHVFSYDDSQLRPANLLGAGDITGVLCKNCMVQYVKDQAGDESYIRTDQDGRQFFVSQHGCEYPINSEGQCVNVVDFGAVPDGVTDSTQAFQDALDTGLSVCVPEGVFRVSQITINDAGQSLKGTGWDSVIKALDPAVNLIVIAADNIHIEDLALFGIAPNSTTTGTAIEFQAGTSTRYSLVNHIQIFSDDPLLGFNNGVFFGTQSDASSFLDSFIDRLHGTFAGRGVGVEIQTPAITIANNRIVNLTGPGRGRQGILLTSSGVGSAALNDIRDNDIAFMEEDGIAVVSLGGASNTFANLIHGNLLLQCCSLQSTGVGSISLYGHCAVTSILDNTIIQSGANGILVDGTGVTDLTGTLIANNNVEFSRYWGITVISATDTSIVANLVKESSQVLPGGYSNIELRTDGVTVTDRTLVASNYSVGPSNARAAFEINPALPVATNTKIMANFFPACVTGSIILTAAIASIDGRLQSSQAYDPPLIANNASFSTAFLVPGAVVGDVCGVTHTGDLSGMTLFAYVDSPGSVTAVLTNNSGAGKDVVAGTINIDVWKRDL